MPATSPFASQPPPIVREVPVAPRAPDVVTRYMPAAPPAVHVDERHHNHVVEVPYSPTDRAWSEAHKRMIDAYPGTKTTLQAVERLKDQILRGEPLPQ